MDKEHREEGTVSSGTYMHYVRAACGMAFVAVLWLILCASTQALQLGADWFLSYWVELDESRRNEDKYTVTYAVLVAVFTITCFARAITFMLGAARVRCQQVQQNLSSRHLCVCMSVFVCSCLYVCMCVGRLFVCAFGDDGICRVSSRDWCVNWVFRVQASGVLNDGAFSAVVATSVRFFDTNPVGRILNRFSKVSTDGDLHNKMLARVRFNLLFLSPNHM